MRIGVDIDGVLTDIEKYQIDLGTKYFYLKGEKIISNYKAYHTTDMFCVGKDEDDEFWNKIIRDYVNNEPARKFANEVIRKLRVQGHEIYIITARSSNLSYVDMEKDEMQDIVLNWLKKNDIYYDKIIFTLEDKLNICLDNKIDLMIEDKPKNINEISKKIPVFCFHSEYNEHCVGKNITRCYSWYDIYAKIIDIFK